MNPLDHFLRQPSFDPTPDQKSAFEMLLTSTLPGGWVDYHLPIPKWQFLSYICQQRDLVLHGSQNREIETVFPRKALDIRAYSAQDAIYATTDGIWVIYYAIVDRFHFQVSLFNSCITVRTPSGPELGPLYFFSVTQTALIQNPWSDGAIYILPRNYFEQEPAQEMHGVEVIFPHWVSYQPITPVAKLKVGPKDFPFLDQIHGHDDDKLAQLASIDPNGFPWPDALVN